MGTLESKNGEAVRCFRREIEFLDPPDPALDRAGFRQVIG
jgi:hypothetical protein